MNRHIAIIAMSLVGAGCSDRDGGRPGAGIDPDAQRSNYSMARVPAWLYNLTDPVFAPNSSGACSPETMDNVKPLAGRNTWLDRPQYLAGFAIDKRPVSCAEYQVCVTRNACRGNPPNSCNGNRAHVTLDQAIAYCRWRGAKLPTLEQWQAAVRGLNGKESALCDDPNTAVDAECTITNDAGVTTSTGWDASEFTRTMACWPAEAGERGGLRQLRVAPLRLQLNVFVPFDPKDPRPKWMGFRCARDEAGAANP